MLVSCNWKARARLNRRKEMRYIFSYKGSILGG